MTEIQYRAWSAGRIYAITANTLIELARQRVFYVLLIFGLLLIGSSAFLARFTFQQEFQILKDISLGAISIFSSLLAIVATARLIPQDIDDRTLYTILTKPVPRFEYLLGKLLGVFCLLAISVALMSTLFAAVLYWREQVVLNEAARQSSGLSHEQVTDAFNAIRDSGIKIDIFTIVVVVAVYFIGHLQARFGG